MLRLRDLVRQVLTDDYLSISAENQLHQLLLADYDLDDLKAFTTLQQVILAGRIEQESAQAIGNSSA